MFMKTRGFRWLGATVVVAVLLGLLLAVPAWAGPSGQGDEPGLDSYTAMHAACEAGDIEGMTSGMDAFTEEGRGAMEEHMSDGHHGAMGSGMMGGRSGMMSLR